MPKYRVYGELKIDGVWIIDAPTAQEACEVVEGDNAMPFEILEAENLGTYDVEKL